jgi:hypothetical protein
VGKTFEMDLAAPIFPACGGGTQALNVKGSELGCSRFTNDKYEHVR